MIKLANIKKTYAGPAGPVEALKNINLEIATGEIFGIIGLSGAGKSTLVRCINLLERPTSGSVIIDDQDLTEMSASELRAMRKKIGMIFQHFNLLSSATVYDNVAFPLRLDKTPEDVISSRVTELLEMVGLADKADQYPSQLSGGQNQRVGIARALASEPKILLCDEATSALDPQTTQAILNLILEINQKMHLTVVVITHEMQVIKDICDKVAVLKNGVIVESDNVSEVFINPQEEMTREFVGTIIDSGMPSVLENAEISAEPIPDGHLLVRLTFIGAAAHEAVIQELIRSYPGVEVSILWGSIGQIKDTPYGRLLVRMTGTDEAIQPALAFLKERKLRIEVIGYVPSNDRALD